MKYTAKIIVKDEKPQMIAKAFQAELKSSKKDRSHFEIKTNKNNIEFNVFAEDGTALRGTLDTISSLLSVYEKAKV